MIILDAYVDAIDAGYVVTHYDGAKHRFWDSGAALDHATDAAGLSERALAHSMQWGTDAAPHRYRRVTRLEVTT